MSIAQEFERANERRALAKCEARCATLSAEVTDLREGQEALKAQTVRIRHAAIAGGRPRDGVDTEQIVRELAGQVARLRGALKDAAEVLEGFASWERMANTVHRDHARAAGERARAALGREG